MTLFNAKDAIADVKRAIADKPKRLNPFQVAMAENKLLKDENARMRIKLNQLEPRITSLEGFRSAQETFNTGTQERVGQLQRLSAGSDLPCPGCGQPCSVGAHGVWCFRVDGG